MRKFTILLAIIAVVLTAGAESLYVGTYNIRMLSDDDARQGDGWTGRYPVICDMMNFEAPDAFGAQEVLYPQLQDMLSKLDRYDYIGVGREDGKTAGEYSPIFYNTATLNLLNSGTFWLSETPEEPGVLGWDAVCPRVCTWGEFTVKEGGYRFWYFNLHMDHIGVVARREAAKLVVARIREICKGGPVILTGDFNVDQKNEIFKTFSQSGILKDSFDAAKHRFITNGTFNAYKSDAYSDSRIDHVFVSPEFEVKGYGVLTNSYWTPRAEEVKKNKAKNAPDEIDFSKRDRRNPSDHYPVMVKLNYYYK